MKKPASPFSFVPRLLSAACAFLFCHRQKSPLLPVIKDIIRKEGPLSVERYMEIVLQHPTYGYYRFGDPIGGVEDFCTAPEASQMFGEVIGLWCLAAWQKMGSPDTFTLLELGPGHGTLLLDLLRFTEPMADFHKALKVTLFESNATLRDIQRQKLAAYNPVYIESLDRLPALPTLVIANEFFDSLPTRQITRTKDGWRDIQVALKKDKLALVESEKTLSSLPDFLSKEGLESRETGWVHEISEPSRAIVKLLAAHIVRHGGAGLIVDFGYVSPSGIGTLDAWSRSRPTSILSCPGKTDVTADVDFGALYRSAKEAGARVVAPVGQGKFLLACGIAVRAKILKDSTNENSRKKIEDAFRQLVSSSQVGEQWKVLEFYGK